MVGTKAKWFRPPGSKPVYEPQRPGRRYPAPVKGDDYRLPGSYPGDRRRPIPEPLPSPEPRVPNDPRFLPGREYGPIPERGPRPVSPPAKLRRFGRKVPKLRIPGLRAPLLDIIDFVDAGIPAINPDVNVPPILPWNYYWCNGPVKWPNVNYVSDAWFAGSGSCTVNLPLTGQAVPGGPEPLNYGILLGQPRCYWKRRHNASGVIRGAMAGSIQRSQTANPQPLAYKTIVHYQDWSDPNLERWLPTFPDPFPIVPIREFQIGYGTPLVEGPEGFDNPDLPFQPDHAWQFQVGIGLTDYVKPPTDTPVVVQPTPPAGREPPARNERQGKLLSKAAKLGIALYKILDGVSEGAEIVDAFYDALPSDVRKRWEKERFPDAYWIKDKNTGKWERVGVERPGDNFGQYGIDGADWKLQALYYNWHRVDYEKAVVNVFKNELSDKVIGDIQKRLPRNAGAAHSQGELEFAATLDEWLDVALEYF